MATCRECHTRMSMSRFMSLQNRILLLQPISIHLSDQEIERSLAITSDPRKNSNGAMTGFPVLFFLAFIVNSES